MTHLSFSVFKRTFLKTTRKLGSWGIGHCVHLRYQSLDPPHQLLQVLYKQVGGMFVSAHLQLAKFRYNIDNSCSAIDLVLYNIQKCQSSSFIESGEMQKFLMATEKCSV